MNTIYKNGQVVTVDDNQPKAEAVVVENGIIKFVGTNEEALKLKTDHKVVDLDGKTMVPGFVDPHSHFMFGAMLMGSSVSLAAPPVGSVESVEDIISIMKEAIKARDLKPGDTIVGISYDETLLKEKRTLTKDDLDKISTEHGIFIAHQSMHVGCMNTFLLDKYEVTSETKNPEGGVICRYSGTNIPNGYLEENAFFAYFVNVYTPDPADIPNLIKGGCDLYASNGVTTAQEGGLDQQFLMLAENVGSLNIINIDVVGYIRVGKLDDYKMVEENNASSQYNNHFRIGGVKLILDGSPQAKTAWLSKPYYIAPEGLSEDYSGYPVYKDNTYVEAIVNESVKRDLQILAHCNGDQASEQFISSYEKAKKELGHTKDLRPVMIHAQTVREDQLDRMANLNMIPSFFHDHTFFWGDWHLESVLGPERGARISPQQSAIKRGIPYTTHQDTPVVPPNMMFTLWAAVNRKTRSGRIIGEDQTVSPLQALKAITINSAYQHFEEDTKGSITVGKRADLVILDNNPLTVENDVIKDIKVLETIKDGKTIFSL